MSNHEPLIFEQSSSVVQQPSDITVPPQRSKAMLSGIFILLLSSTSLAGLVVGYLRGEAFARKNAQYDNPQLRDYYSAKCYEYWETKFKVTVESSIEKFGSFNQSHAQKLEVIHQDLKSLDQQVTHLALTPPPAFAEPKPVPKAKITLNHKGPQKPVRKSL